MADYLAQDEEDRIFDEYGDADEDVAGGPGLVLPFDPLLFIKGVVRKLWILALATLLGLPSSYWAARNLVGTTYVSKAVLLKRPEDTKKSNLSLLALSEILTLPDVLKQLRKDLSLHLRLKDIRSALDIDVQPRTGIIRLALSYGEKEASRKILEKLIDIFVHATRTFKVRLSERKLDYYKGRLEYVRREKKKQAGELRAFKEKNGVIDLNSEVVETLNRYNNLDAAYRQYKAEAESVKLQLENLDNIVKDIEEQLKKERRTTADADSITNMKQKSVRLREKIKEIRQRETWKRRMEKLDADIKRVEALTRPGYVPRVELENLRLERDLLATRMYDSKDILKLRAEIERIDHLLVPTGNNNSVNLLLKDTMIRRFSLRLDRAALQHKARQMKAARDEVGRELDRIPEKEGEYARLNRKLAGIENYERIIISKMDELQSKIRKQGKSFKILQHPTLPDKPERSKKKLLFGCFFVTWIGLAILVILAAELRHVQIRIGREIESRLGCRSLGMIFRSDLIDEEEHDETIRYAVQALSREAGGKCFLLTGPGENNTTTRVCPDLALHLFKHGYSVAIVEANDDESQLVSILSALEGCVSRILDNPGSSSSGFKAASDGITIVPFRTNKDGDSARSAVLDFGPLVEGLRNDFDFVLIDGPALSPEPCVSLLKWSVDKVILVIESAKYAHWEISGELTRAGIATEQLAGVFLTEVDPVLADGRGWSGGFFESLFNRL